MKVRVLSPLLVTASRYGLNSSMMHPFSKRGDNIGSLRQQLRWPCPRLAVLEASRSISSEARCPCRDRRRHHSTATSLHRFLCISGLAEERRILGGRGSRVADLDHSGCSCKPELTSNQGNDFSLRVVIAFDVAGGRPQARMTCELLDVSQAPAHFADFPRCARDECSATGMR